LSTETPEISDSEFLAVLLTSFAGFFYGFSLGVAITQKFSKHRRIHKLLKIMFPPCFGILAFINIINFVNVENNQLEWFWPTNEEQVILLVGQFLINNPLIILQLPLLLFVTPISFIAGFRQEEEGKRLFWLYFIFWISYVIFMLTPAEPNRLLIGMYIAFNFLAAIGVHHGIKQDSKINPIIFIINWIKNRF